MVCEKGHSYESTIGSRTAKHHQNGCPECNRRRLSKPVRCIETGECFQTIKEASQKAGICKDSITKNLTEKNKSAGGYHWEHIKIDINENN